MRFIRVLPVLLICSGCAAGYSSPHTTVPPPFKLVLEDDKVLLFDSAEAALQNDPRRCHNVYASPRTLARLRKILGEGREPVLRYRRLDGYFDRSVWSPSVSGHYLYQEHFVADRCQPDDLVVIEAVR